MNKSNLEDWVVCGRVIGQASGWDQMDTFLMQLYDFKPHAAYRGPIPKVVDGCININFENGIIQTYNDDGSVLSSVDLLHAIENCPARTGHL